VVAVVLSFGWVPAGSAGVVDSPLPSLGGLSTRHVFTIPGVIKYKNIETVFECTSLETSATITVGVEVFGAAGGSPKNDVTVFGNAAVAPGATVTITTGSLAGIHEDAVISNLLVGDLRNGSARIISTSSRITCTALLADDTLDPPTSMVGLHVIAKKKQGGD
jgi:hypothetical protein